MIDFSFLFLFLAISWDSLNKSMTLKGLVVRCVFFAISVSHTHPENGTILSFCLVGPRWNLAPKDANKKENKFHGTWANMFFPGGRSRCFGTWLVLLPCFETAVFSEGMRCQCHLAPHQSLPGTATSSTRQNVGWAEKQAVNGHLLRRRFARFCNLVCQQLSRIIFVIVKLQELLLTKFAGRFLSPIFPAKRRTASVQVVFVKFTQNSFARQFTFGGSRSNNLLKKKRSRRIKKSRKKRSRRWKETSFITAKWWMYYIYSHLYIVRLYYELYMVDMMDALMCMIDMRLYLFMFLRGCDMIDVDGNSLKHWTLHILGLYFDEFQKLAPNQAEKRKEVEAKLAEEEKARQAKENSWSAQFPKNRKNWSNQNAWLTGPSFFWGYFQDIEIQWLAIPPRKKRRSWHRKQWTSCCGKRRWRRSFMNIDPKKKSSSTSLSLQHIFFSIFSGGFWQVFVHACIWSGNCSPTFLANISPSNVNVSDVYIRCTQWYMWNTYTIPYLIYYMMHGWT